MSNSHNNYKLFESPYAKSVAQYPSQSDEYIPFELKRLDTSVHKNRQTPNITDRYTSTPAKNEVDGASCRLSVGERSGHFYPHRQQTRKRGTNSRNRIYSSWQHGGNGSNMIDNRRFITPRQQTKHIRRDFESYFHSSMLDDPWKELMERYNAIRKSQINLQIDIKDEKASDINECSTESSNTSSEEEMQD